MTLITQREIDLLQFNDIRKILSDFAVTPIGHEKALELMPIDSLREIKKLLKETSEAFLLLEKKNLSVATVPEIRPFLTKIQKGGIIDPSEALKIMSFIRATQSLQKNVQKDKLIDSFPLIAEKTGAISGCNALLGLLEKIITSDGEISDNASPGLREIRGKVKKLTRSVREKLDNYLKSPTYRKYLQEPLITIRNERYVIPVKLEYRSYIPGIYHDQSSSGATIFIEPFGVADLQNKLQHERNNEEKEKEKIMFSLSSAIETDSDIILNDLYRYSETDFILAKGRLSSLFESVEPEIAEKPLIMLLKARHPLLKGSVVPVDITLGEQYRTMIITGPNTGGKTVTLKTVGLFTLMVQCGLHIPVVKGSKMGVFKKIRADIGDEQSIEQSLSTFSSHLNNIINIIKEADSESLILLDELGAGTDPSEGAALARSILMELYGKGALVITTTHINDLKVFAQIQDGVENASLEFDPKSLAPTYRLITGVPGSSNAMVIAARLGLTENIISRAKNFLSDKDKEIEEVIKSLNIERKKLGDDSLKALIERKKAESLRSELEKEKQELVAKKDKIMAEAKLSAKIIVKEAKGVADDSIAEIKKTFSNEEERRKSLSSIEKIRRTMNDFIKNTVRENNIDEAEHLSGNLSNIKKDDIVFVKSLKQEGAVKDYSLTKESVTIQIDDLTIKTNISDIQFPLKENKPLKKKEIQRSYTLKKKSGAVSNEVSLRGLTMEEATAKLDKFLDDAILYGLDRAYIIHGRGTGKLRRGVKEIIKNSKNIKNYRIGYPEEGGIGVTVVYFK